MSDEIVVGYHIDYRANIELLLQQKDSRFRSAVMVENFTGKSARPVEQIGAVTAQKRTTRHADTPLIETPHSARWVYPVDYEWADLIDDQDKLRRLSDPTSPYAVNGANSMRRAMDDEIIAAFFATSSTGENGSGTEAFSSTYQVAETVGAAAATGMNIAKLRSAKQKMMAAEVDVDNDPLFCAISSVQHDELLAETQATSLDFNTRPVLVEGRIRSFMGFNFIDSERLGVDSSSYRRCPAWAKSGMCLGVWEDIMTKISERGDKSYATQVYVRGTFGATRLEQGKVTEILCSE